MSEYEMQTRKPFEGVELPIQFTLPNTTIFNMSLFMQSSAFLLFLYNKAEALAALRGLPHDPSNNAFVGNTPTRTFIAVTPSTTPLQ